MRLNPPTVFIFLISLLAAIAAVLTKYNLLIHILPTTFPQLPSAFWWAMIAYVVLMIGNLVRGL